VIHDSLISYSILVIILQIFKIPYFSCEACIYLNSDGVENVVPERGGNTEVSVLVSVMVLHVLLFKVLKCFEFKITTKVEPIMHRIVKYLCEGHP